MFDVTGKNIKKIADIIFGTSLAIGFILLYVMGYYSGIFTSLIAASICIMTGYVLGLFLSVFGELIASIAQIKQINQEILNKLQDQ